MPDEAPNPPPAGGHRPPTPNPQPRVYPTYASHPYPGFRPQSPGPSPKETPTWQWVVLSCGLTLLVVAAIAAYVALFVFDDTGPGGSRNVQTAQIGKEVRDGKFAFTLKEVKTAESAGGVDALGKFVIVTLAVKNTGKAPHSYDASAQKLVDGEGKRYPASAVDLENQEFDGLNPGLEIEVKLAFDVPENMTVDNARLELHDFFLSDGAELHLT